MAHLTPTASYAELAAEKRTATGRPTDRLRATRQARRLTVAELARKSEVPESVIVAAEAGGERPSLDVQGRLSATLDVG